MIAKAQLVSFHLAAFVVASLLFYIFFIVSGSARELSSIQIVSRWLLACGLAVVVVSTALRAHSVDRWREATPHGASIFMVVGHLATLLAGYIYFLMLSAGSGSGVVFIPFAVCILFSHSVGIVWTAAKLALR